MYGTLDREKTSLSRTSTSHSATSTTTTSTCSSDPSGEADWHRKHVSHVLIDGANVVRSRWNEENRLRHRNHHDATILADFVRQVRRKYQRSNPNLAVLLLQSTRALLY